MQRINDNYQGRSNMLACESLESCDFDDCTVAWNKERKKAFQNIYRSYYEFAFLRILEVTD